MHGNSAVTPTDGIGIWGQVGGSVRSVYDSVLPWSHAVAQPFACTWLTGSFYCWVAMQVESLLEGPRLQNKLDNERAIIQSLNML